MSSRVLPAAVAVFCGVALAVVLLLPFVLRSYRRRGELGWRHAAVAFAFLVYAIAIATYTLLPLPQLDDAWCAAHTALRSPQTSLAQFAADIAKEQPVPGRRGVVANPAVQQIVFNIALFVPLGAFLRHSFRLGVTTTVAIGFAVSLLVECTQLTGNWFLFPCPYRVFDVDDLAANTLGAAVGILLAPLLAVTEGRGSGLAPDVPRPVTTARRLLGMLLDVVAVVMLGGIIAVGVSLVATLLSGGGIRELGQSGSDVAAVLGAVVPPLLVLVLPALGRDGATLGQRTVLLRRVSRTGQPPPLGRKVLALLAGTFGSIVFGALSDHVPLASLLTFVIVVAAPIGAWRSRGHRGFSGWVSGLETIDARATADAPTLPVALPGRSRG